MEISQGKSLCWRLAALHIILLWRSTESFVLHSSNQRSTISTRIFAVQKDLQKEKQALLGLIGRSRDNPHGIADPVLADPETKEPIRLRTKGALFGDTAGGKSVTYEIVSSTNKYKGSSSTYIDLLEPKEESSLPTSDSASELVSQAMKQLTPFLSPPLRYALANVGADVGQEYVPMRDLFTSPSVAFAYERGWRQGFAQAGFPGADKEFEMAKEYFAPALTKSSVVVDMSCATGLFTRRFALEDRFDRVLGCDYSDSMLTEARRRIEADSRIAQLSRTRLDLVRLDVGKIPIQDAAVDALHAGAAMHCWPELDLAVKEIYRVLKPGGRYFATTFLSQYFTTLQQMEGAGSSTGNGAAVSVAAGPSRTAFQYFASVDQLRKLLESGGFQSDKIRIEVLGTACVVIRCEK